MSALDSLKTDFAFEIRSRGKEYFLDNQVELDRCEPGLIRAKVAGTDKYRVVVRWDGGGVAYSCTCPFYQDRDEPCKHIWASLLEADHDGVLEIAARRFDGPKVVTLEGAPQPTKRLSLWQMQLQRIRERVGNRIDPAELIERWPDDRRMVYAIDPGRTDVVSDSGISIRLMTQKMTKAGKWGESRRFALTVEQWLHASDETDREIARLIVGADRDFFLSPTEASIDIPSWYIDTVLKKIIATGRCFLLNEDGPGDVPMNWDDGPAFRFTLEVKPDDHSNGHRVLPSLSRDDVSIPLAEAVLVTSGGYVVLKDRVAKLDTAGAWPLLAELKGHDEMIVPAAESDRLLTELLTLPSIPYLTLPSTIGVETVSVEPRPELRIFPAKNDEPGVGFLNLEVWFDYAGQRVPSTEAKAIVYDASGKRIIRRDRRAESLRLDELMRLEVRVERSGGHASLSLPTDRLAATVIDLNRRGWHVEARGSLYRSVSAFDVQLKSGINWFDLDINLNFEGAKASTPELLKAIRSGQRMVVLDDGSIGVLPDEWLARYATVLELGDISEDGSVRFAKTQTALLDAMLRTLPEARVDEVFAKARLELSGFGGIEALDPPAPFVGTLREYQREGLGWLNFLRRFGFGGCLADDMGLGKTIQVLALLESRRVNLAEGNGAKHHPSLVVVPRSLVFNWINEAKRFTPKMKVLDHSGVERARSVDVFLNYDLVITTYGTLRRDIAMLKDFRFDYVILDESQAVKNSNTASAKSVRLLSADHRLAMSGTPVENHLGELWSLFDFLNPGMLGRPGASNGNGFLKMIGNGSASAIEARQLVAQAVRPFILRRTKNQVAKELPARVEQTIVCELDEEQRKLYDDLKDHYRLALLGKQTDENGRSTMQVLEALLRLRQVACHPALIDASRANTPSAKFDMLLDKLVEIHEAGSKALVFSQFTSLLNLLKPRLDERGIVYEYLDGQTRDRQKCVERFQNDADCRLFLISLKAGGVGLNLTAAEYVFLLDPWWNPAVEAQAIDRAHRIGQTRTVFAYRLIAKDTIEEKVIQLQNNKRDLADAIINEDNSLIRGLTQDDLRMLLS
ncbi:MAG TPA: DEAD/DEAH box helicase [Tepidisphaeraceae bacterium]|nr:DEAD/DEAH box helicase [Tepidisphaeraceae bacterium]